MLHVDADDIERSRRVGDGGIGSFRRPVSSYCWPKRLLSVVWPQLLSSECLFLRLVANSRMRQLVVVGKQSGRQADERISIEDGEMYKKYQGNELRWSKDFGERGESCSRNSTVY